MLCLCRGQSLVKHEREIDFVELGSLKYFCMTQKKGAWQRKLAPSHDCSNAILNAIEVWIGSHKPWSYQAM